MKFIEIDTLFILFFKKACKKQGTLFSTKKVNVSFARQGC